MGTRCRQEDARGHGGHMEAMKQITIVEPIVTVESTVKADTIEKLTELAKALLA